MRFHQAFDANALRRFDGIDDAFVALVFGATVLDWQGFLALSQSFREGFPNGQHVFDLVVAEGDAVATIGRYKGRHEGSFMGIPATGRDVDFTVMHVDRVRNGRIVERPRHWRHAHHVGSAWRPAPKRPLKGGQAPRAQYRELVSKPQVASRSHFAGDINGTTRPT